MSHKVTWILTISLFVALHALIALAIAGWFPIRLMVYLQQKVRLFPSRLKLDIAKETRRYRTLAIGFILIEICALFWSLIKGGRLTG